jgi:hypothetical protein
MVVVVVVVVVVRYGGMTPRGLGESSGMLIPILPAPARQQKKTDIRTVC